MDPDPRQKIDDFISLKGLRKTVQREAIIRAASGTARHFTAEELIAMARRIEPSVSRATVYRTLQLLVECRLLKEIDLGENHKTYDPNFANRPHHNHIICSDCRKVFEFEDPELETLAGNVTKRHGFTLLLKTVRIEASCDQLRKHGICKHRPAEKPKTVRGAQGEKNGPPGRPSKKT